MSEVLDKAAFEARYRFVKAIGGGGQGGIYLYHNKETGERCVVKEYGCLTSREWRMLASLTHPHICSLVDKARYENRMVQVTKIVVEAMDISLQAHMLKGEKRCLNPEKDMLDLDTARNIFYCVALALDYLHHKLIVHLDVKLDNILLRQDSDGKILKHENSNRYCVKLADFGLAFLLGGDGNIIDGTINNTHKRFPAAGTCRYMAPEVEFDSRYGVKADVFSAGVVLHVMLTGRYPKTALNEQAEVHPTIPQGLKDLLLAMLHGDPYQRPHMWQVLDHDWLSPVRQPGDTLLGDLDEAEKGSKVMLLQVRREQEQQQQQPYPQSNNMVLDEIGLNHNDFMDDEAEEPPFNNMNIIRSSSPTLWTEEGKTLGLYVVYMDLAEINDPSAALVVCGTHASMERVKKEQASTLGAVLVREGVTATVAFGQIFEATLPKGEKQQNGCLKRIVRKSGVPFEYVRSLWAGLCQDKESLNREAIWRIYNSLRRLGPELAKEKGTSLYLPMMACDDRVKGFSSGRCLRQAIIQESVGLAQYLAETIPADQLDCVTLYTWQKDALHVLMDFVKAFREDFQGVISASWRLDDYEYKQYVGVLVQAVDGNERLKGDGKLRQQIKAMDTLNTYPEVCEATYRAGQHLQMMYKSVWVAEGLQSKVEGALEVLHYNLDKTLFDGEMTKKEAANAGMSQQQAGMNGRGLNDINNMMSSGWVPMVGHYDSIRSLHALLSVVNALIPG